MAVTPRPKIERAEAIPVRIPMAGGAGREAVILRLDAQGLEGLGEAAVLPERGHNLTRVHAELEAAAAGFAAETEPSPPLSAPAAAALETALLDLEARSLGVPLADRLGGLRSHEIRCNALITVADPARVAADVEEWAARGFSVFKLKSANRGGPVDAERLGAARYAAGAAAELRIDFNGGLNLAQASTVLPALREFQVRFVEQPLAPGEPLDSWLRLRQPPPGIELLADESLADPELADQLAAHGVGLALKLAAVGGPIRAVWLAGQASGPTLVASSYETSIGIAAALHVAAALARPEACGLATLQLLEADIGHGLGFDRDRLLLPEGAGLGVALDESALARYRLDR
jgi:muconate cycloisomerase